MWNLPKRVWSSLGDATVGTAIVMVHALLSGRERQRSALPSREHPSDRGIAWQRADARRAARH